MPKIPFVSVYAFLATLLAVFGLVSIMSGGAEGGILLVLVGAFFGILWAVEFWKQVK